jgi:hypothetical protein
MKSNTPNGSDPCPFVDRKRCVEAELEQAKRRAFLWCQQRRVDLVAALRNVAAAAVRPRTAAADSSRSLSSYRWSPTPSVAKSGYSRSTHCH